ncbi:antigen peptide transporter 2a [Polymixia lowei]
MAVFRITIAREIIAFALVICIDLAQFYAAGYGVKSRSISVNLAFLWVFAILRCSILIAVSLLASGSVRQVLVRCVTAHCFLAPVLETGRDVLYGRSGDCVFGVSGDAWCWMMCATATAAGALFWEIAIPDTNNEANGKEKKQQARVLFVRVLHLYKHDYLLLLGASVFLSLAVLCDMFIPFYTGKVIDILGSEYQSSGFLSAILFMGLFSLGNSFSAGLRGGLFLCAVASFTRRVKVKLFGALVNQEIGFFETNKTGEITSRLSKDTKAMGMTVALNVNVLLRTFIKTLGMISLMMSLSWELTLLMLMDIPIAGLIQNIYDKHYQRLSKALQDSMARANDTANEAVSAIRVVRSFHTEQGEARRYDDRLMDTHRLKTQRDTVRAVYLLARRVSGLGMQMAMLYFGRLFIQRGQMTTGNLVSFILYQTDLGNSIRTLIYIVGDMLNSVGAAEKVFEYLDREPQVKTRGTEAPNDLKGHVKFQGLTFSYPLNNNKPVLQDFSVELKPGQTTALVGPSGEGKTTCVSLLERFYEPQNGDILLDGRPLKSYQHRFLHRKIALVGQDPVLFSGSIRDNIAYGLADCSLDEIQEAARRANIHDFISQLDRGYDTVIGEGGGQLSKSERQRIAIARALVRQPQVLILDEITSSLDTDCETKVQQALAQCPNRPTRLIVAHRLKTIEKADQIVVIGQGRVQERGTHQELMEMKGNYYRLREKLFTECSILISLSLLASGSVRQVLVRCVTAHCLLAPVLETGRDVLYGRSGDCVFGLSGDAWTWMMCATATAAGALFWEIAIPDTNNEANGEEEKQQARVLFLRVLHLYKHDYLLLLGASVFLSLAVLCDMFIPFYTGKVIDILGSEYQSSGFLSAILFMGLFSLGNSFCAGLRGGLFLCAVGSFTRRVKVKLFGALVNQEIGFFETNKTGEITSRLSKDTKAMGMTVALNVNVLLRTFIKTLGMISLMMSLSWELTLLMLMDIPIAGLIQNVYDKHYQRLSKALQDSMARANDTANEAVSAIRVVRSFHTERGEARRYDDRLMDTHRLKTQRDIVTAVCLLARRVSGLGMQMAMLYFGRMFIQRGQMTTGNLVSFILYQTDLGDSIRALIYTVGDMLNSVEAARKVFEYQDRKPQVNTEGTEAPNDLKGHVKFQGLTFSYPLNNNKPVLQDFSVELKPGQTTALVGPSGEGKTTCVSLLERFYEPQNGEILLDGRPLESYQHRFLHRKIALVGQDPVLFSGSIRDNIAYGLADCSLDEIQEAACRANIHDFISQLDRGYDTVIGEGGGQLSKSERQRIAIARALVRQPQVLILDEITSSLDTDCETKVQQALAQCPNRPTRLIVAHRLKTIEKADQIVVIGQGRVQERGTHQELMEKKGNYYRLREKLFTEKNTIQ